MQSTAIIFPTGKKAGGIEILYKCARNSLPSCSVGTWRNIIWCPAVDVAQHKICHFPSTWNIAPFLTPLHCACLFGNADLPPYFNSWSDIALFYNLPSDWKSQADLYCPSNVTDSYFLRKKKRQWAFSLRAMWSMGMYILCKWFMIFFFCTARGVEGHISNSHWQGSWFFYKDL